MTNKKLKLAAMSVALTACVAAQPMAAHAVEGPDANADDTATPQAGPTAMDPVDDTGSTAPDTADGEEDKQEEFTPPVNDEAVATDRLPAFGPDTKTDDITIDYKPAEKPEEPGDAGDTGNTGDADNTGDTDNTGDADNTGDTGDTGDAGDTGDTDDTDDTKKPDGTYMEGDVIDNSKKDEITGEDGKVIGSATKEETPDSSSSTTVVDPDAEVKKGESVIGKDEDGNTTITTPTETTGTETTTTTGTGTAKSDTTITDTKETEKGDEIDLDEELKNKDGVVENPTWETKTDDTLGGYTVDKVDTAEDGNSKTLTLKKTETSDPKAMSAEDIAKLLDVSKDGVEKETDAEGNTTYTLTKTETSTDENGNTVTRTTYYKITGNTVETHTETKLIIRVTKGTVSDSENVGKKDPAPEIRLPSITANKTSGSSKKETIEISAKDLDDMLKDPNTSHKDNVYTYEKTVDGKKYTYTITKTDETSVKYSNEEIAKLLGPDYIYDEDGVYYKDKSNKLSITEMDAIHKTLSYKVDVTEESYLPNQDDGNKDAAAEAAKLKAIKAALRKAAQEANIDVDSEEFKNQLETVSVSGSTFEYITGGHTFTFNYTVDGTVTTDSKKADDSTVGGKDATDVKDNTVTGTAYVTSGKETWSQSGNITGTSTSILGGDYTQLPEGVSETQVEREGGKADGRITKITYKNEQGEDVTYTFTYYDHADLTEDEKAALVKAGVSPDKIESNVTRVEWKSTTVKHSITETDQNTVLDEAIKVNENGNYTIKFGDNTYTDFKKTGENTYSKIEGNKTTTITVSNTGLDGETVQKKLADKYGVNEKDIKLDKDADGTSIATWTNPKDGSTVKVRYSDSYSQLFTVSEVTKTSQSTDDSVMGTYVDQLVSQVQDRMGQLDAGDQLILKGDDKNYTITKTKDGKFTISDGTTSTSLNDAVSATAKKTLTDIIEKSATSSGLDYSQLDKVGIWNLLDIQQQYADGVYNKYTNGKGCDSYWPESGYENIDGKNDDGTTKGEHLNDGWWNQTTHFDSLRLDAEVSLDDGNGNKIDGLILPDDLVFEYGHKEEIAGYVDPNKYPDRDSNGKLYPNKDKQHEVTKDTKPATADLNKKLSVTQGTVWNSEIRRYQSDNKLIYDCGTNSNSFDGKRFYSVSGKVAYNEDSRYNTVKAAEDRRDELLKDNPNARVVAVPDKTTGEIKYVVYKDVAELKALGLMTTTANTNALANSEENRYGWTPGSNPYRGNPSLAGYDLRLQDLKLVKGKAQGDYGVEYTLKITTVKNSTQTKEDTGTNSTLKIDNCVTTSTTTTLGDGIDRFGGYNASYTKDYEWKKGTDSEVKGEGNSSYKTFTEILRSYFTGEGSKDHNEGGFNYSHRTPDEVTSSAVSKTTTTKTEAQVGYDYTTIETRKVTVSGEETVVVPPVDPDTPDEPDTPDTPDTPEIPDTPDTPVQDETPDEVVTPETPELPPVQDATPDEAVTPANPELPAVQDATALPQTGVNWFTALGMAFSGMLLMIAGAFTSLKYKEKH